MRYDWISFTTDYGLADGFVAVCRGVIAGIAPAVGVIDVTHAVPAQDVLRGAMVLAQSAPYLPDAVHLAVVDPGVGTGRRPVAVVAGRGLLVGPDNGLLLPAAAALGGLRAAYELVDARFHLPEVSRTFHGRDVFAPVAAHLANGLDPAKLGPRLDVAELVRLAQPDTQIQAGEVRSEVVAVDHFGNLQLAVTAADLAAAGLDGRRRLRVQLGGELVDVPLAGTFADVEPDSPVLFEDSAGVLSLAVNRGSAASRFGARPGTVICLGG